MEQTAVFSDRETCNLDFDSVSTITLRCSLESGVPHTEFEWTDYCPEVFRNIQDFWEMNIDDYMDSIRCRETLKLLISAKKNSSLQLPHDDCFIIKILCKSEMKVFMEMLPRYYQHIQKNKNTLLTKFFGLYVVKPHSGPKIRFVVIGNVLRSDVKIHKQVNLRVPSQNRNTSKTGTDEDLNMIFYLQPTVRRQFMMQIKCDCNFLEEVGIMNYSFSLGMHVSTAPFETLIKSQLASASLSGSDDSKKTCDGSDSTNDNAAQDSACNNDIEPSCPPEPVSRLGVKIGARAVDSYKKESSLALTRSTTKQDNNVILYFGVTNILQGYTMLKQVEHVFKTLQSDNPCLATNPRTYSNRFQEYICTIFPENDSDDREL